MPIDTYNTIEIKHLNVRSRLGTSHIYIINHRLFSHRCLSSLALIIEMAEGSGLS